MGYAGLFVCKDCHEGFKSRDGGGFNSVLLRCEVCDWTQLVGYDEWPEKEFSQIPSQFFDEEKMKTIRTSFKCQECHGQMRNDLSPLCPKCGSRNTAEASKARTQYKCKHCNQSFIIYEGEYEIESKISCNKCGKTGPLKSDRRHWFDMETVNRLHAAMKKCADIPAIQKYLEERDKCECGGAFVRGLTPRCPLCQSRDEVEILRIMEDGQGCHYD